MERTSTQFDAVYENGVLRPLNPVDLPEHERLSVIVNRPADPLAGVLDWDAHELAATEGDESISLEDVQAALSKIPGSMLLWCPRTATNDRWPFTSLIRALWSSDIMLRQDHPTSRLFSLSLTHPT